MDLILPGITGGLVKLYDDLVDNNQIHDGIMKESMFTLICLLFGAISRGDFLTAFVFYLMNFANYIADPTAWKNDKEKSILLTFPVLLLLSYTGFPILQQQNYILLGILVIGAFIEALIIKEEYSIRKLSIRIFAIVLLTMSLYYTKYSNVFNLSFTNLIMLGIGYLSVSVLSQIVQLTQAPDVLIDVKLETPAEIKTDIPEEVP
jgi:hypothetical protein